MSRKKLLMATVAVISSASAGAAFGQTVSNQAFIGQLDQSNLAYLSQVGTNRAFVYQYGNGNFFLPFLNGAPSDGAGRIQ
jgi:hypothetical protein